jgi:hypothetical protein
MDETKAREIIGNDWIDGNNAIHNCWEPGWDGFYPHHNVRYTADELEAIAWWMTNKGGNK